MMAQDILESLRMFAGGDFLVDRVIEEIQRLRAELAEMRKPAADGELIWPAVKALGSALGFYVRPDAREVAVRAVLAAVVPRIRANEARDKALIEAVQEWAANNEGVPDDRGNAELLKALWTYEGDRTKPCDECDGDCGEPCAPCTVAQAHAWLDRWMAEYPERQRREKGGRAAFVRLAISTTRHTALGEAAKAAQAKADTLRSHQDKSLRAGVIVADEIAAAIRKLGQNGGDDGR